MPQRPRYGRASSPACSASRRRCWWMPGASATTSCGRWWRRGSWPRPRPSRRSATAGDAKFHMTDIYVDGDACPVREEVYRVAERLDLKVFVVSNGSRPIRPVRDPNVSMVVVSEGADKADDWIVERITAADVCVTSDIPLASRCLTKGARAVSPSGRPWTPDNIGNALAGREIARHLR